MKVPAVPSFFYICQCGTKRYFKDSDIGREDWCANCSTFFVIQDSSQNDPLIATDPVRKNEGLEKHHREKHGEETRGSGSDSTSSSNAASYSSTRYTCSECGETADYPRSPAGSMRFCQICKALFTIPKVVSDTIVAETKTRTETQERLGRYELREHLGEGGMGVLWTAWDPQLHRLVALKQIHHKFLEQNNAAAKRRMVREAIITAGLTHPNIISIHALEYDENENPFYTMPLLEGTNLKFKILQYHKKRTDKVAIHALLRHFIAICRAVGYAHDRRIMHRDIKPDNIHFDGYGSPVLIDWGLAKKVSASMDTLLTSTHEEMEPPAPNESESVSDEEFETNLTLDGHLVGTRRYWAPEYRRTKTSVPSNDIYALGLVLYYILCGVLPYTKEEIASGAQHYLPTGAKHPSKINPAVDNNLANICLKCLYYDIDKRMSDAKTLAKAVDLWLGK